MNITIKTLDGDCFQTTIPPTETFANITNYVTSDTRELDTFKNRKVTNVVYLGFNYDMKKYNSIKIQDVGIKNNSTIYLIFDHKNPLKRNTVHKASDESDDVEEIDDNAHVGQNSAQSPNHSQLNEQVSQFLEQSSQIMQTPQLAQQLAQQLQDPEVSTQLVQYVQNPQVVANVAQLMQDPHALQTMVSLHSLPEFQNMVSLHSLPEFQNMVEFLESQPNVLQVLNSLQLHPEFQQMMQTIQSQPELQQIIQAAQQITHAVQPVPVPSTQPNAPPAAQPAAPVHVASDNTNKQHINLSKFISPSDDSDSESDKESKSDDEIITKKPVKKLIKKDIYSDSSSSSESEFDSEDDVIEEKVQNPVNSGAPVTITTVPVPSNNSDVLTGIDEEHITQIMDTLNDYDVDKITQIYKLNSKNIIQTINALLDSTSS